MKGRFEFMEVLTADPKIGIEFVERFQLARIAVAVILPVALSALLGILYSIFTDDVSSGFTVSGKRVESQVHPRFEAHQSQVI